MVMVLLDQEAVTPGGKPVAAPMPVAPVVVKVMAGIAGLLAQYVLFGTALVAVILGVTVIVPVAFTDPQPPVRGIE
jgi:hypothetical protein